MRLRDIAHVDAVAVEVGRELFDGGMKEEAEELSVRLVEVFGGGDFVDCGAEDLIRVARSKGGQ